MFINLAKWLLLHSDLKEEKIVKSFTITEFYMILSVHREVLTKIITAWTIEAKYPFSVIREREIKELCLTGLVCEFGSALKWPLCACQRMMLGEGSDTVAIMCPVCCTLVVALPELPSLSPQEIFEMHKSSSLFFLAFKNLVEMTLYGFT